MQSDQIIWFKSTFSQGQDQCVESSASLLPTGKVPVRDSKDPGLAHLKFSMDAFAAFIGDVKSGVYDV